VPTAGVVCRSPDIIVTQSDTDDFGQGSGTEESDDLGSTAVAGAGNWVYVRARNLGSTSATGATARVWWSEPALLITPEDWHEIGEANFPAIPGNASALAVAGPLKWDTAPAPGHYCFVAIVDCPTDPAPPLPALGDWDAFLELIRANNSVAWRNFDVLEIPPGGDEVSASFLVRGAPDRRREFGIELEQHLPAGAFVELTMPAALEPALRESPVIATWRQVEREAIGVRLSRLPRGILAGPRLAARSRYPFRFTVGGLAGSAGGRITFQQTWRGRPVGQLTYAIRPAVSHR
jgi:hypothetical protein